MMLRETGIEGSPVSYPLELKSLGQDSEINLVTINNESELFRHIEEHIQNTKTAADALKHAGIERLNLLDERTAQFIHLYEFYENNPHLVSDSSVWMQAYTIIKRILGVRL